MEKLTYWQRFKQWLMQPPRRARVIDLLALVLMLNFMVTLFLIIVTLYAQQNSRDWAKLRTIEIVRQADPPDVIYIYPAPNAYPEPMR